MSAAAVRPRWVIGRMVVPVIVVAAFGFVTVDAVLAKYFDGNPFDREPLVFDFGPFEILVGPMTPHSDFILLGIIAIALVAIGSVALEAISTLRVLHPPREHLRGPRLPPGGDAPRVIALIPAHNEAANLPLTLPALGRQTRPPDRVLVVADNCTDDTVAVARAHGAEARETVGNTERKAGALNQALAALGGELTGADVVLVLDADTRLGEGFIAAALEALAEDDELDAIGGLFFGEDGHGLIGQLQRNEYHRYQLQIQHRQGRVFVLTGTASMFRAQALMDVAAARGTLIPGRPGDVYNAAAITEDNELTIALKSLGCRMLSPRDCVVVTELMPDWGALWVQRKRWQRGALDNLSEYGVTSATLRYWGQQVGIAYGTIALVAAYAMLAILLLAASEWVWYPFWIAVTLVFMAERVATVWHGGWRARLVAAPLVIEIAYSFYLQANFVSSLVDLALGRSTRWGHLPAPQRGGPAQGA